MKLYNTMSGETEDLRRDGHTVKIYCCGPTVYNLIHLGNARQICVFDTLRRYLRYRGFDVFYIQNFTDVDDKIIKKAAALSVGWKELTEGAIADYFKDADGLNVMRADVHPRVSENIAEIIDLVQRLIDKGCAYVTTDGVYFSVAADAGYGRLSRMPLDQLRENAGLRLNGEDKRDPMDFAVWKKAKAGEPYWDSPFMFSGENGEANGRGRPGWHIECSAMAHKYAAGTLDIHGGGADLVFPHHENEIAQSECGYGGTFAKMWVHNEMLNINSAKMAKSVGNVTFVRSFAADYGYMPLRYFLLSAHYRSQINFTISTADAAVKAVSRLFGFIKRAEGMTTPLDGYEKYVTAFEKEMDSDLNTANGFAALFEFMNECNVKNACGTAALDKFKEMLLVLGLDPAFAKEEGEVDIPDDVAALLAERTAARAAKDYARADELRGRIAELGYAVAESRDGVKVTRV